MEPAIHFETSKRSGAGRSRFKDNPRPAANTPWMQFRLAYSYFLNPVISQIPGTPMLGSCALATAALPGWIGLGISPFGCEVPISGWGRDILFPVFLLFGANFLLGPTFAQAKWLLSRAGWSRADRSGTRLVFCGEEYPRGEFNTEDCSALVTGCSPQTLAFSIDRKWGDKSNSKYGVAIGWLL